jgi:hypothetical protein
MQCRRTSVVGRRQLHDDVAAVRHGVDRVEQQIGEDLAELRGAGADQRHGLQARDHVDEDALGLHLLLPARARQLHGALDHARRIDHGLLRIGRAVELAQPPHGLRRVHRGRADGVQHVERLLAVVEDLGRGEQEIRESEDRHQRVVEVVRHAAGHLPERAEAFVLDHVRLRLLELLDGLRELAVGLPDLALHRAPRGHVPDDGAHPDRLAVLAPYDHRRQVHGHARPVGAHVFLVEVDGVAALPHAPRGLGFAGLVLGRGEVLVGQPAEEFLAGPADEAAERVVDIGQASVHRAETDGVLGRVVQPLESLVERRRFGSLVPV